MIFVGHFVIAVVDKLPAIIGTLHEVEYLGRIVAWVHRDADHLDLIFVELVKLLHLRHLLAAGRAPGSPKIHEDGLGASEGRESDGLVVGVLPHEIWSI